jgi:hypothetical protein
MPDAAPRSAYDRLDLAQISAGALIFIASMMPYYTYSIDDPDISANINAWHGFFGWFGAFLGIVAAGILVAALIGKVAVPSLRTVVLALFAGAAASTLLALFFMPGGDLEGAGLSSGHGVGYWLALLTSFAGAALAYVRRNATD